MNERQVGRSGLRVSEVGLGCNNFGWKIDEAASKKVVARALDLGVTLFDTADFYGNSRGESEAILGRALGRRREDVIISTKFGIEMSASRMANASRRYVMQAVDNSLRQLGTDWIDIYMIHIPDYSTPIGETLSALDDLVRSGKVRYIACSNHATWRVVDAMWTARDRGYSAFSAVEEEYSLLSRNAEKEMIPALEHHGLGLFPFFPLASGLLTGKYTGGQAKTGAGQGRLAENFQNLGDQFLTQRNLDIAEELDAFAREQGHSLLELAISWLLSRPVVASVVCGATTPEQIEQNVRAAGWALGASELARIDEITLRK